RDPEEPDGPVAAPLEPVVPDEPLFPDELGAPEPLSEDEGGCEGDLEEGFEEGECAPDLPPAELVPLPLVEPSTAVAGAVASAVPPGLAAVPWPAPVEFVLGPTASRPPLLWPAGPRPAFLPVAPPVDAVLVPPPNGSAFAGEIAAP